MGGEKEKERDKERELFFSRKGVVEGREMKGREKVSLFLSLLSSTFSSFSFAVLRERAGFFSSVRVPV